jgi:hypothetical protein
LVVEGRGDLVADEYVGIGQDRPGQGRSLQLTAGEAARGTCGRDRGDAEAGERGDGFGMGRVGSEAA